MAERATLIQQEQTSFTNAVIAYVGVPVGVIQAQQLLALNINNEQVLAKQLQATNDRFRVGEITRTDVAQAEAALAGATAQRQTSEGNLQTARGTYPAGRRLPAARRSGRAAAARAAGEERAGRDCAGGEQQPAVIAALFNDAAAKDAVDVAFSQLLPQVSFQGQIFQSNNSSRPSRPQTNGYQAVVQLSVPVYQGGSEYSAVAPGQADARSRHSAAGGRCAPHRGAECGPVVGDAGGGQGLGRQHARGRSAPIRSRSRAWSARPSSAAAPRSTC